MGIDQSLFENTVNAIYVLDPKTNKILDVNDQACNILGYSKKELLKMRLNDLESILPNKNKTSGKGPFNKRKEMILKESNHRKKDGTIFPVEVGIKHIVVDDKEYCIAASRDISDEKKPEVAILNALLDGQENERKRISKELHDGLGALLSGLRLNLSLVGMNHSELKEEVSDILLMIDEAMDECRSISHDLVPPALKEDGLKMALQKMAERINKSKKLVVNCELQADYKRLPINKEIEIFRMAQELVHNVLKHAEADNMNIELLKRDGKQILTVQDDGIGFDITYASDGIGLKNLRARAELLSGKFKLESKPGKGTKAILEINIEN